MIERNKSLDIAKAIGIILVVIGHSSSPIGNFIYLFHMPLFFFISGYFYKEEYSNNIRTLIVKRLKTLYLPFVAYQMIFLILHNFFCNINIYSNNLALGNSVVNFYTFKDFIKSFIKIVLFTRSEQLAGAFWFFTTLFIVNIMFCFISFCVKYLIKEVKQQEIFRGMLILISFALGNVCAYLNIHLTQNIEVAFVVLLFYYSGLLYKKYESKIKIKFSTSILFFIILLASSFYGTLSISTNENVNAVFLLYNSFMGIYLILYVSQYLANLNTEFRVLKYIGRNTTIILCLHFLSFKIINLMQVQIYKYPKYMIGSYPILLGTNGWWILYTIVGVFIPIFLKYIFDITVRKINYIKFKETKAV